MVKRIRSIAGYWWRLFFGLFKKAGQTIDHMRAKPSETPVIIMGHQKTGTTAIAALLGKATEKEVSIDPFYRTPKKHIVLPKLYENKLLLSDYIRSNAYLYRPQIIKDPEFVFFYKELKEIYTDSKFVFIIRNPFDNIKSILDRLKIPGDIDDFNETLFPEVMNTWDWMELLRGDLSNVKGNNIIETLALRWVFCANLYLNNKNDFILVKYEEFREDKIGIINNLIENINDEIKQDISSIMNKQFQPKGENSSISPQFFFSKKNYDIIAEICEKLYFEIYKRNLH
ncbi:MAG: sulfotransferase domain-containing protein [Bacteroidetes bacterium]|nr:sulfotransferase domain-containing protein [Bacteroidota bacterium]